MLLVRVVVLVVVLVLVVVAVVGVLCRSAVITVYTCTRISIRRHLLLVRVVVLFSAQADNPSVGGLASLCSFSLLSGDGDLALAALQELLNSRNTDQTRKLKALFNSYFCTLQVH